MKTTFTLPVLLALTVSACSHEQAAKPADVKARIDSLVKVRTAELKLRAAEDFDQRKAVEVKPKVDSILMAHAKKHPDTTKH